MNTNKSGSQIVNTKTVFGRNMNIRSIIGSRIID